MMQLPTGLHHYEDATHSSIPYKCRSLLSVVTLAFNDRIQKAKKTVERFTVRVDIRLKSKLVSVALFLN